MIVRSTWIVLLVGTLQFSTSHAENTASMKCFWDRSEYLTGTCVNLTTSSFFESTTYKFDHRDKTVQCLNCTLNSIEANSFQLSENFIERLVLKKSGIEELQQGAFNGMKYLLDLDLSNNNIKMVCQGTFEGASSTEILNMRNNSLVLISNNAFIELFNLTTLILSESRMPLVMQSKSFNGLNKLKLLNISKSQITNISDVFNNLTSLQYLDLSGNSISTLDDNEFKDLTSLLELILCNNQINKIAPLEFFSMSNLKVLRLSDNFIEQIEKGAFDRLKKLEFLDLANNKITTIPEKIFQYSHRLVNINLTRNKIDTFRINRFAGLPNLEILNLSHNLIKKFDSTGNFLLHDLRSLDLSSNNLTDLNFNNLLHRMPKLSYLNLQNNYWCCELEEELNRVFSGDNFQFFLFDNEHECEKCHANHMRSENSWTHGLTPCVFEYIYMIIIGLIVAILTLFYRQYRLSQELQLCLLEFRGDTSMQIRKLMISNTQENNSVLMLRLHNGPCPAFTASVFNL